MRKGRKDVLDFKALVTYDGKLDSLVFEGDISENRYDSNQNSQAEGRREFVSHI